MKRPNAEEEHGRKKAKSKDELMKLGLERWKKNEDAEAKKLFEEVLEIDNRSADAHYHLCRLEWDKKRYNASRMHVDKCLAIDPNHVRGNVSLGYIYNFNNKTALAKSQFEKAISLSPGIADARYYLAEVYRSEGNLTEAKSHYAKCIESIYRSKHCEANSHYWLCRIAWDEKDYALSRVHVDKCLAIDPDHVRGNCSLGFIYMFNKDNALARTQYERVLALDPKHGDAHYYLGNVLLRQGDFGDSKLHYLECLKYDPGRKEVLSNLIHVLFKLDVGEEAFQHCQKMLQMDPAHVNSHIYLARIYITRKDYESALKQYRNYFGHNPNDNKRFTQMLTFYSANFAAEEMLSLYEDKLSTSFCPIIYLRFNIFLRMRAQDRWKKIEPILNSRKHPFATVDAFANWGILTRAHQKHFQINHPEIFRNLQIVSNTRKFCLHEIMKDAFSEQTVNIIHEFLYFL